MTKPLTNSEAYRVIDPQQLTRDQRLERWAVALERLGDAPLRTLRETEHKHHYKRLLMREDNSPLTVAYDEPILRSAGLQDDTFGEARYFFGLSDWDLHNILCYCHSGATVRASDAASRVRAVRAQRDSSTLAPWLCGGVVTAMMFGTGLLLAFSG